LAAESEARNLELSEFAPPADSPFGRSGSALLRKRKTAAYRRGGNGSGRSQKRSAIQADIASRLVIFVSIHFGLSVSGYGETQRSRYPDPAE
jgi:hypothetical protein